MGAPGSGWFDHEKLEVYSIEREFVGLATEIVRDLPRGSANIGDQLERAASSMMLNTAEGAGRREGREKARFYDIARGSGTECAAALDVLSVRKLVAPEAAARGRELLLSTVKILAKLSRRARGE